MARIFVEPGSIEKDYATLPEGDAKKLLRVLRMKPGDALTLFDGVREYSAVIKSINQKSAEVSITGTIRRDSEPRLNILLGQGAPKSEKLEYVVQKAVELGAAEIAPVILERSVKRPDTADAVKKLSRLRKIAVEAARQSGRVSVPEISCFMDLPMFVERVRCFDLKIIFYEGEKTRGLRELLHSAGEVKSIAILIGPEGGFTEDEVLEAEAAGFVTAGLGPRILRTETAGLAALSIIQYELGDIS
ncbi:MAG: 16S rRNA (uracil(1498)-N(3))-methyltransferase [Nitrospirota bacterium]